MRYLTAPLIYTPNFKLEQNKILVLHDNLHVAALVDYTTVEPSMVQHFEGILSPGFVNTHCHLELSHLHNKIPQGTGLVDFLSHIRGTDPATLQQKINEAYLQDKAMYSAGTVAVGDISNHAYTIEVKLQSKIKYHTFVECLGVDGTQADDKFSYFKKIFNQFSQYFEGVSMTLHALYSCSFELFNLIQESDESGLLYSMHHLETLAERSFFNVKDNALRNAMTPFVANNYKIPYNNKSSTVNVIPLLNTDRPTLLVHNTYIKQADFDYLGSLENSLHYCTCPQANQYIEGTLPDYNLWKKNTANITIGTDSLASNNQLSMIEEINCIQHYAPYVPLESLLKWATHNGAFFLDVIDTLGSFEKDKKPGVVQIIGERGAMQSKLIC